MTAKIIADDDSYFYLTTSQGTESRFEGMPFEITEEDRKAIAALKQYLFEGMALVVRHRDTGRYGIVLEGSEYPTDASDSYIEPGYYDGKTVNGIQLAGNAVPSLGDAIAHVSVQADELNSRFPGLGAQVHHGTSTFGGHVTLRIHLPAESSYLKAIPVIADSIFELWHKDKAPEAAPAP